MSIEYKVVALNKTLGSISVNYFNADNPSGWTYNIDIPLDANGAPISGDALIAEINSRAPVWMFERAAALKTADFSALEALVVAQPSVVAGVNQPTNSGATVF